jgi:hypothetical protein
MDAPPGGGFGVNVFLRGGETVYRTWHTNGRGTEQLGHTFPLLDLLPYGRQEEWQDVPEGWPQARTYSHWSSSESSPDTARKRTSEDAPHRVPGHRPGRLARL